MPLSKPRYTLSEAIGDPKDWIYTWALADDVTLESRCGFCGQTEQRITYQVTRGDDRKWVCQRCVGRYAIGGVLDGYLLEPAEVRAQIHGLTARLKQQTCQDTIREVQAIANDPALEELLVYFDRNLQLCRRGLPCCSWRCGNCPSRWTCGSSKSRRAAWRTRMSSEHWTTPPGSWCGQPSPRCRSGGLPRSAMRRPVLRCARAVCGSKAPPKSLPVSA